MSESYTLIVSGRSSELTANYFPPIELSPHKHYALALAELQTFNAIPNIDEGRNKLYIDGEEPIVFPTGSYEIEDIHHYAEKKVKDLTIKPNNYTLRSELKCSKPIDFRPSDSIGPLLGFTPRLLPPNVLHESDLPVAILKINALRVECNFTGGAYINERRAHTIHNFFPSVPPGYKTLDVPPNPIYLPVTVTSIHHLQLRIVDQDGHLINFRGEEITVRLHIKSI